MQNSSWLFKYKWKLPHHNILVCFKSNSCINNLKLNVLFFGTDHFSLQSLISLNRFRKNANSKINQLEVVTSFKAKENPVRVYAEKHGISCFDWPLRNFDYARIKYDLGIVVSFGHLIPETTINMFPLGMINVHASLLPRWRGSSPIIHAILNEDEVTGVSIMKIQPHKFDIGEILAQKKVPIPKNVLMPELHEVLANEGAQLLTDCIENVPESLHDIKKQGHTNITYAPKVQESMALINWQTMSARYICNLYRALYSFKWLTTHWHKRRVKFKEIDISRDGEQEIKTDKFPGAIEYDKPNKCLRVYCGDGSFIKVKRLTPEGKVIMTAADFNNGFLKKVDRTQQFFT